MPLKFQCEWRFAFVVLGLIYRSFEPIYVYSCETIIRILGLVRANAQGGYPAYFKIICIDKSSPVSYQKSVQCLLEM